MTELPDPADLRSRWSHAWRPAQAAERLAGVEAPWCVVAGWALDLFRGARSRPHGDLEIAVPAAGFPEIRARFPEYQFDAVGNGRIRPGASPEALSATFQTWLRDPATGRFLLDVFREPHEARTWICRRHPALRLPYDEIIEHTADGIPYLIPELVLLFKAKAPRPKDQKDFDTALPLLNRTRRAALSGWLERAHPGHPWQAELAERAHRGPGGP